MGRVVSTGRSEVSLDWTIVGGVVNEMRWINSLNEKTSQPSGKNGEETRRLLSNCRTMHTFAS